MRLISLKMESKVSTADESHQSNCPDSSNCIATEADKSTPSRCSGSPDVSSIIQNLHIRDSAAKKMWEISDEDCGNFVDSPCTDSVSLTNSPNRPMSRESVTHSDSPGLMNQLCDITNLSRSPSSPYRSSKTESVSTPSHISDSHSLLFDSGYNSSCNRTKSIVQNSPMFQVNVNSDDSLSVDDLRLELSLKDEDAFLELDAVELDRVGKSSKRKRVVSRTSSQVSCKEDKPLPLETSALDKSVDTSTPSPKNEITKKRRLPESSLKILPCSVVMNKSIMSSPQNKSGGIKISPSKRADIQKKPIESFGSAIAGPFMMPKKSASKEAGSLKKPLESFESAIAGNYIMPKKSPLKKAVIHKKPKESSKISVANSASTSLKKCTKEERRTSYDIGLSSVPMKNSGEEMIISEKIKTLSDNTSSLKTQSKCELSIISNDSVESFAKGISSFDLTLDEKVGNATAEGKLTSYSESNLTLKEKLESGSENKKTSMDCVSSSTTSIASSQISPGTKEAKSDADTDTSTPPTKAKLSLADYMQKKQTCSKSVSHRKQTVSPQNLLLDTSFERVSSQLSSKYISKLNRQELAPERSAMTKLSLVLQKGLSEDQNNNQKITNGPEGDLTAPIVSKKSQPDNAGLKSSSDLARKASSSNSSSASQNKSSLILTFKRLSGKEHENWKVESENKGKSKKVQKKRWKLPRIDCDEMTSKTASKEFCSVRRRVSTDESFANILTNRLKDESFSNIGDCMLREMKYGLPEYERSPNVIYGKIKGTYLENKVFAIKVLSLFRQCTPEILGFSEPCMPHDKRFYPKAGKMEGRYFWQTSCELIKAESLEKEHKENQANISPASTGLVNPPSFSLKSVSRSTPLKTPTPSKTPPLVARITPPEAPEACPLSSGLDEALNWCELALKRKLESPSLELAPKKKRSEAEVNSSSSSEDSDEESSDDSSDSSDSDSEKIPEIRLDESCKGSDCLSLTTLDIGCDEFSRTPNGKKSEISANRRNKIVDLEPSSNLGTSEKLGLVEPPLETLSGVGHDKPASELSDEKSEVIADLNNEVVDMEICQSPTEVGNSAYVGSVEPEKSADLKIMADVECDESSIKPGVEKSAASLNFNKIVDTGIPQSPTDTQNDKVGSVESVKQADLAPLSRPDGFQSLPHSPIQSAASLDFNNKFVDPGVLRSPIDTQNRKVGSEESPKQAVPERLSRTEGLISPTRSQTQSPDFRSRFKSLKSLLQDNTKFSQYHSFLSNKPTSSTKQCDYSDFDNSLTFDEPLDNSFYDHNTSYLKPSTDWHYAETIESPLLQFQQPLSTLSPKDSSSAVLTVDSETNGMNSNPLPRITEKDSSKSSTEKTQNISELCQIDQLALSDSQPSRTEESLLLKSGTISILSLADSSSLVSTPDSETDGIGSCLSQIITEQNSTNSNTEIPQKISKPHKVDKPTLLDLQPSGTDEVPAHSSVTISNQVLSAKSEVSTSQIPPLVSSCVLPKTKLDSSRALPKKSNNSNSYIPPLIELDSTQISPEKLNNSNSYIPPVIELDSSPDTNQWIVIDSVGSKTAHHPGHCESLYKIEQANSLTSALFTPPPPPTQSPSTFQPPPPPNEPPPPPPPTQSLSIFQQTPPPSYKPPPPPPSKKPPPPPPSKKPPPPPPSNQPPPPGEEAPVRLEDDGIKEAEKTDHLNPDWDHWKKLKTDKERYRKVRKMWKNLRIPNPKVNLTVRNSQRWNGYAPPIRHLRENPAISVFDVPSIHCGTIFEDQINEIDRICSEKIDALQHQMQGEIENQNYKYHQVLRNAHTPVQAQQIQNAHFTFLSKTRECFENKRDQLQREAEWEKERLQDVGHEVVSFHEFYDDLDGEKPEYSTRLSGGEYQEISEINEMLKEYYQFYQ